MAKGYDPDKYVNDLTKSAEGVGDLLTKNAEKIEKAQAVQKTKDEAAKVAADKVADLLIEKTRLVQNRAQIARLIATAKGEPLPDDSTVEVDEDQEALPV